MENLHIIRHSELLPPEKQLTPIKVIGAGAIGSFAVLQLAKLGYPNIEVWDFDTVSVENMSCQFYRFKDIGKSKVESLADVVFDFTESHISFQNKRFEESDVKPNCIYLIAVDDMEARMEIADWIRQHGGPNSYIIDTRMGAEDCLMYTMNLTKDSDWTTYNKTLYSNSEAVQDRCTAKSTIYTANLLSGQAVKTIKDISMQQPYSRVLMWSVRENDYKAFNKGACDDPRA